MDEDEAEAVEAVVSLEVPEEDGGFEVLVVFSGLKCSASEVSEGEEEGVCEEDMEEGVVEAVMSWEEGEDCGVNERSTGGMSNTSVSPVLAVRTERVPPTVPSMVLITCLLKCMTYSWPGCTTLVFASKMGTNLKLLSSSSVVSSSPSNSRSCWSVVFFRLICTPCTKLP